MADHPCEVCGVAIPLGPRFCADAADCHKRGYARERTARQAAEAALSRLLERPSAQALAAAQARATAAEAKLRTAEEALGDVKLACDDDEYYGCGAYYVADAALAALRSQVAPAAGRSANAEINARLPPVCTCAQPLSRCVPHNPAQWTARAGDPCMVEGCTEKIAVACLPSEFKACERHFADHERDCRHCGPAQREEGAYPRYCGPCNAGDHGGACLVIAIDGGDCNCLCESVPAQREEGS